MNELCNAIALEVMFDQVKHLHSSRIEYIDFVREIYDESIEDTIQFETKLYEVDRYEN